MMLVPSTQHALRQVEVILVKMERISVAFVVAILLHLMLVRFALYNQGKQKLVVILMVRARLYLAKQLDLVERSILLVVVTLVTLVVLVVGLIANK
jgi:hypothetical protein